MRPDERNRVIERIAHKLREQADMASERDPHSGPILTAVWRAWADDLEALLDPAPTDQDFDKAWDGVDPVTTSDAKQEVAPPGESSRQLPEGARVRKAWSRLRTSLADEGETDA